MSDHTQIDIPELKTKFLFRRRPMAIPGDLRPGWRIGLLVLLLNSCCRSGRTSLARLHVLSWGIRTKESRRALQAAIDGTLTPDSLVVRFDPFLNGAVDFAIGEELVRRSGGSKIELTPKGRELAVELEKIETAYVVERKFIAVISQSVTERMVDHMFGGGV
jgi:hypothetical protein